MNNIVAGDMVKFIRYENKGMWETGHGLYVGDIVKVLSVECESLLRLETSVGDIVWSDVSQVVKCATDTTKVGVKYDSDKLEYSLLPKGVLNKVINVLGFGSKKYAKDNWMKVDNPKERYYNAAQRHINQWWEGEKFDKETGENHLAHAICCLMFMLWFDNQEDKEINE